MAHPRTHTSLSSFHRLCNPTFARALSGSSTWPGYYFLLSLFLLCTPSAALGQAFLSDGQFFTRGLAISDAPAPGSPQHSGSNIVIAVDISGDGKIQQGAFIPGSGASTRYDSLEIYLVSSQTGLNLTVSNGTGLLTQELGSTVKHLNWPIPDCVPPGVYNLTYYESSHINSESFYSITPLNVTVDNPNQNKDNSQCERISNMILAQPQSDSAPLLNPYLDPGSGLANAGSISSNSGIYTITVGESGLPPQWSIEPSGSTVTITDEGPFTTVTIVMLSSQTLTQITTVSTTTLTAVMATSAVSAGGFLPVNAAASLLSTGSLFVKLLLCFFTAIVPLI